MTLPDTGTVYIDAQVLIYAVEPHADFAPRLSPLWPLVDAGIVVVVTSELSLLETAVMPMRNGDDALLRRYADAMDGRIVRTVPLDRSVLLRAARLRADVPKVRIADAIHVATYLESGCTTFLTNDHALAGTPGANVVLVSDLPLPTP